MFKKKTTEGLFLVLKYMFLALVGGTTFFTIGVLFQGHSRWSMFILGEICFLFAGAMNETAPLETSLCRKTLCVETFTLISEFVAGCVVNIWLGLNVWDYSNLPGDLLGQICWQFAILFLPLCAFAIILDDYVRYYFFDGEKPHYTFF